MGASFLVERLEQLIKSGTAIFDILPSFVYHRNPLVRVAALEVMYGVCVGGGRFTDYQALLEIDCAVTEQLVLHEGTLIMQPKRKNHKNKTYAS